MNFRTPKPSRDTKLWKALAAARGAAARAVLAGRTLIVDPSSGSDSSQPGYCVLESGVVTDSGVVDMPVGTRLANRLRYLNRCMREQFPEKFDVLVLEDSPSHRFSKSRSGRIRASFGSQISLHKASGVIESCFDVEYVVHVSPQTWHSFAPEDYVKSDEGDAICMGHAVCEVARAVVAALESKRRKT